jgi:hypothetical protein
MSNTPDNSDDVIDSRDIIERLETLTDERADLDTALTAATEAVEDYGTEDDTSDADADHAALLSAQTDARAELAQWDEDNAEELKNLTDLNAEGEGAGDWQHGETMVRDSYFETYAQELADDCGMLNSKGDSWPYTCIDWERAARELQQDYTSVDFGGVTYWLRS